MRASFSRKGRHSGNRVDILLTVIMSVLSIPSSATGAEMAVPSSQSSENPLSALQKDWSRGMWVVRESMFFSGYSSIDDYLKRSGPAPNPPPLTPEFLERAAKLKQSGAKAPASLDPSLRCRICNTCVPYGIPLALTMPEPFKWQFSQPYVVTLSRQGYRQVFMNGLQRPEDWVGTYFGFSVGHWQGSELVIETSGIREEGMIEPGTPHTDELRVTERWRQTGPDELQNTITMTDPKAFSHPWVVTRTYQRQADLQTLERPCLL